MPACRLLCKRQVGKVFYFYEKEKILLGLVVLALLSVILFTSNKKPEKIREFKTVFYSKQKKENPFTLPIFIKWKNKFILESKKIDSSGMVAGIFLGDDSTLDSKTRNNFKQAGVYHLLAASGFNCWIVSMFFIIVFGFIIHIFYIKKGCGCF